MSQSLGMLSNIVDNVCQKKTEFRIPIITFSWIANPYQFGGSRGDRRSVMRKGDPHLLAFIWFTVYSITIWHERFSKMFTVKLSKFHPRRLLQILLLSEIFSSPALDKLLPSVSFSDPELESYSEHSWRGNVRGWCCPPPVICSEPN